MQGKERESDEKRGGSSGLLFHSFTFPCDGTRKSLSDVLCEVRGKIKKGET